MEINYLADLQTLIKNGYTCDTLFADKYTNARFSHCRVLFDDPKYMVAYDNYKCRILFDKKNNLKLAIVSIAPWFPKNKVYPNSLYILNNELFPLYSISTGGEMEHRVNKYIYQDGNVYINTAVDKESIGINIDTIKYKELIEIINKIKNEFSYKDSGYQLDNHFYGTPYWTEGIR